MFDKIRGDIARKRELYAAEKGWLSRQVYIYFLPGSLAVIIYRFGRWVFLLKIPVLKQILTLIYLPLKALMVICFGITIPVRGDYGKGFVIHTYGGIFLPRTKGGENLTVNQEVTVGGANRGQPLLGDNVFLGAGAKVLGKIKIGNNVVVGANSLVITDVPDNCTVIGVPARIVFRKKG